MAWTILRDPFWCLIIALGMNGAAYSAELFAGAMRNVSRGVVEASRALGLSWYATVRTVIFPIALRSALPAYSNEIILTVKATSLAVEPYLVTIDAPIKEKSAYHYGFNRNGASGSR